VSKRNIEEIIAAWKNPELRTTEVMSPIGEVSDEELDSVVGGSDEVTPQTTIPCGTIVLRSLARCPSVGAKCKTRGCRR
jgi:mersacidin/lichenicidin family type 2 lantibiotic